VKDIKEDITDLKDQYVPEYIEGAVEICMGVFICFFGGPMITVTVKLLLFIGMSAGLLIIV